MVYTQEGIYVIHRLGPDIGELLDLGGGILDLRERERENGLNEMRYRSFFWLQLTSSSVSCRPSCSTRDLTAFHPVKR